MTVTLYGIKNCDTMKKARKWLDDRSIDYRFHDLRIDGLDEKTLRAWVRAVGWEALLNTRGMTWRKLPDASKVGINESKALALMLQQPAVIKRPVLKLGNSIHVGFKEPHYLQLFAGSGHD